MDYLGLVHELPPVLQHDPPMDNFILPPSPNPFRSSIIAVSADGVLVLGCKRSLYFYNIGDRELTYIHRIFHAHESYVNSIALSSTKNIMASAGQELTINIWSLDDYQLLTSKTYHTNTAATALCWDMSGSLLSGDMNGNIYMWSPQNDSVRHLVYLCGGIVSLACSPFDNDVFAVGYEGGSLVIGTTAGKGHLLMKFHAHTEQIIGLLWRDIDNKHVIVSVSLDSELKVWSTDMKKNMFCLSFFGEKSPGKCRWYCICPLIDSVCAVSDCRGKIYKVLHDGSKTEINSFHNRPLIALCNYDGLIITVGFDRKIGSFIYQNEVYRFGTMGAYTFTTCVSRSGGLLATGGADNLVRVFSLTHPEDCFTPKIYDARSEVKAIAWHPFRDHSLVFGTNKGRVGFIDAGYSTQPIEFSSFLHNGRVLCVCWLSSDGKSYNAVSLGDDGEIIMHSHVDESKDRDLLSLLVDTSSRVSYMSTCKGLVATGTESGEVHIFSQESKHKICSLHSFDKDICRLQFHPSTLWLAVVSKHPDVHLFNFTLDATSDVISMPNVILRGHKKNVTSSEWNDNLIATSSYDCTVIIWNAFEGEMLFTYTCPDENIIRAVCWNPCSKGCLISGSDDDALHFWSYNSLTTGENKTHVKCEKRKKKKKKKSQENIKPKEIKRRDKDKGDKEKEIKSCSLAKSVELGGGDDEYVLKNQSENCVRFKLSSLFSFLIPPNDKQLSVILHVIKQNVKKCSNTIPRNLVLDETELHYAALWTDWKSTQDALKLQAKHHFDKNNSSMYLVIKAFCGDFQSILSDLLQKVHALNEFALLLIANAQHERYTTALEHYINQIEHDDPLKAAVLLLSLQKLNESISLLDRHDFHLHKLVLTRARLINDDNALKCAYVQHAESSKENGDYFLAALSFIAASELERGIKVLFKNKKLSEIGIEVLIFLDCISDAVTYVNRRLIMENDWSPDFRHDSFKYIYALKCLSSILKGKIDLDFSQCDDNTLPVLLFHGIPLLQVCKNMMQNHDTAGLVHLLKNLTFDSPLQVPALILSESLNVSDQHFSVKSLTRKALWTLVNKFEMDSLIYLLCCTMPVNKSPEFSDFWYLAKFGACCKSNRPIKNPVNIIKPMKCHTELRRWTSVPSLYSPKSSSSVVYDDSFILHGDKMSYIFDICYSRLTVCNPKYD